jgi:hypothetical protein
MKIILSPQRRDDVLSVTKAGDILSINGEIFDFSPLPDGATIPSGLIPCDWIVGAVHRIEGQIVLSLIAPHGPNPPPSVAFPSPLIDVPDGEIAFPGGTDVDP